MTDYTSFLGLEIAETSISGAITDAQGNILERERKDVPEGAGTCLEEVVTAVIRQLEARVSNRGTTLVAVGACVPAVVDPSTGNIQKGTMPHALAGIDLGSWAPAIGDLPLIWESMANAAAYGELRCGAAQGMRNMLYLHLGPDISAGIIQDGRLYRGTLGFAGGFGHMTVQPDGLQCVCGNTGCLETIASGTNLVRRTKERLFHDRSSSLSSLALPGKGELTAKRIAMEALEGDDFALMMLERTGRWIGLAVANAVNLLNLDMVVLSGNVMVADHLLVTPITQEVAKRALVPPRVHCRIVAAQLGGEASVVGSAMLAREHVR